MGKMIQFQSQKPPQTVKVVHIIISDMKVPEVEEWRYKSGNAMVCIIASSLKVGAALFNQYVNGKIKPSIVDGDAENVALMKQASTGGDDNE